MSPRMFVLDAGAEQKTLVGDPGQRRRLDNGELFRVKIHAGRFFFR